MTCLKVQADSLVYHRLDIQDAPRLSEFLLRQPPPTRRWFHPFPFDVRSIETVLSDSTIALYALVEVGIVAMWLLRDLSSDLPEFGLVVDASRRRQGLGQKIVRLAQQQARELGKSGLWLSTYVANYPARRLYYSTGFVDTVALADGQIRMEYGG